MSAPKKIIDISTETVLRIGAKESPHKISWDILREVGDRFQNLVQAIAKHSMSAGEYEDLGDVKLDFTGFYDGSPMPAFRLADEQAQTLFYSEKRKQNFLTDFSSVFANASKGNYQGVVDHYGSLEAKKEIIKSIYTFSHSAGDKPITIVKIGKSANDYQDVLKIKAIDNDVIKKLNLPKKVKDEVIHLGKSIDEFELLRIGNRTHRRKRASISDANAITSIKVHEIPTSKGTIKLANTVLFEVHPEGKGILIENEMLDIFAGGASLEDAKNELYSQFEHTYKRLKSLPKSKLGVGLANVKAYYQLIVKSTP